MSIRHTGLWHYEHIPARGAKHAWRVGDEDDDPVTDFATEAEAQECVRRHNATVPRHRERWS